MGPQRRARRHAVKSGLKGAKHKQQTNMWICLARLEAIHMLCQMILYSSNSVMILKDFDFHNTITNWDPNVRAGWMGHFLLPSLYKNLFWKQSIQPTRKSMWAQPRPAASLPRATDSFVLLLLFYSCYTPFVVFFFFLRLKLQRAENEFKGILLQRWYSSSHGLFTNIIMFIIREK